MKAIIVKRYNGWELSEESGGPLVKFEDVREAVEQHDKLVAELKATEHRLALYVGAIQYMSQYNGRTVCECLELAAAEISE